VIESEISRSGRPVLRANGRLLASGVDPVSEASEWLNQRRTFLDKVKSVFVLGAGSGYHIAELLNQTTAKIVVIEVDTQLIAQVRELHAFDSDRVSFVALTHIRDIRSSASIRIALQDSYVVLQHNPSVYRHIETFRDCRNVLVARDWGNLNWQWQLRGSPSLDPEPRITKNEQPLTILDLEQTELVRNSEERERMLVKALRELVK
jgi:hypothetical protein